MTFRDLLSLVWGNLSRMRGRAVMTAMGVVIGTAAIVILIALASGLQENAMGDMAQFGPVNQITVLPGSIFRAFGGGSAGDEEGDALTPDRLDEIAALEHVVVVTPKESLSAPSTLKYNQFVGNASFTGVDPRAFPHMNYDLTEGTDRLGQWTVIIGSKLGEAFRDPRRGTTTEDDPLDLYGQTLRLELTKIGDDGRPITRTVRLRVGGVLAETGGQDDYAIYIDVQDVDDLTEWFTGRRIDRRVDGYSQAVVIVDDPANAVNLQNELFDLGFFAFSALSTLQTLNVLFAVIQAIFGGIGAIALIVAAIGIANTMVMSVLERTREIGLMKAVGATNRDVMSIFIAEAGAIGLLGGILGVIVGVGGSKIIDIIAQTYINAQLAQAGTVSSDPVSITVIPIWLPIFAIIFSLIVGLGSGIYPALRAVQLDPVMALKYE